MNEVCPPGNSLCGLDRHWLDGIGWRKAEDASVKIQLRLRATYNTLRLAETVLFTFEVAYPSQA
jgi:hypothetical protein